MKEYRKLAAVMFTDIVGYTALMSQDELKALLVLQKNRDIQKPLVEKFNGEFLKEMGDGTLLCFQSALDAVQCAQKIQKSVSDDPDLNLRIGIHLGDIVFKDGDVFGDGVNVASRIEHLAEVGGIFISGQVYDAVRNKPGIKAVFVGEKMLKNISHPVKIYTLLSEPFTSKDKAKEKSIAVLPFTDMSQQKDQEYFCEGMAEELINALTKVARLQVASRTSAFQFKGKGYDICEIGKKLNVQSVLEGSIRKAGNKLRITAQLVDVSDGYHLWSEKYDRDMEDIFAIQDEISLAIVDNLKVKLLRDEKTKLSKHHTKNKEAYNLYLKGRYFWNRRTEVGFNKAFGFFQSAIEIDPNYALAFAGLAECYCMLSMHLAKPEPFIRQGRIAAEKALSIDETLAEAHAALGWIKLSYDWDWLGAERSFKQAIQLDPRYPTAYNWYAALLGILNRHEEAIRYITQAQEYDPGSAIINRDLGIIYAWAGDFEKAIKQLQFTIDMDPDFTPAYFHLGIIYVWMKKYDLAIEYFKKVRAMAGDFFDIIGILGFTYAKSGQKEEALSELKKLEDLAKNQDTRAFEFSLIHTGLGNNDQAFEWLDIACKNHEFAVLLLGPESELWFEDLLPDPKFKEFLIRIGIEN
jgi:TolB-like protein/class 3 adenylate cyclase/Tfp pilus assembly protein PilF